MPIRKYFHLNLLAKMAKLLLPTQQAWVQIPALAPFLIDCSKRNPFLMFMSQVINISRHILNKSIQSCRFQLWLKMGDGIRKKWRIKVPRPLFDAMSKGICSSNLWCVEGIKHMFCMGEYNMCWKKYRSKMAKKRKFY